MIDCKKHIIRQALSYIACKNISMDFISGQKGSSYHRNYLCDDFTDRLTARSFSL